MRPGKGNSRAGEHSDKSGRAKVSQQVRVTHILMSAEEWSSQDKETSERARVTHQLESAE